MRVLVCGGRDYDNYDELKTYLSATQVIDGRIDLIIHGGATGADTLAGRYAARHDIPIRIFHADWSGLGRAAGPIRNQRMLVEGRPDLVVAFPGGKGTADMVRRAKRAGITVRQV